MQKLTALKVRWCEGVNTAGMEHISKMQQLTHLDVSYCDVDAADLEHISRMPNLTELILNDCDGLEHIRRMHK
jgi:hypothetical protein